MINKKFLMLRLITTELSKNKNTTNQLSILLFNLGVIFYKSISNKFKVKDVCNIYNSQALSILYFTLKYEKNNLIKFHHLVLPVLTILAYNSYKNISYNVFLLHIYNDSILIILNYLRKNYGDNYLLTKIVFIIFSFTWIKLRLIKFPYFMNFIQVTLSKKNKPLQLEQINCLLLLDVFLILNIYWSLKMQKILFKKIGKLISIPLLFLFKEYSFLIFSTFFNQFKLIKYNNKKKINNNFSYPYYDKEFFKFTSGVKDCDCDC